VGRKLDLLLDCRDGDLPSPITICEKKYRRTNHQQANDCIVDAKGTAQEVNVLELFVFITGPIIVLFYTKLISLPSSNLLGCTERFFSRRSGNTPV
jgi:hypothetical protein